MLTKNQLALLAKLESTLNRDQFAWLAGYAAAKAGGAEASASASGPQPELAVLFATETGNAKMVAQQLAKAAKGQGWKVQSKPIGRFDAKSIAKLDGPVVFVAATHGEGDPPETCVDFFEILKGEQGTPLNDVSFATLGLGDSSYPDFCQFARNLDAELERLGATSFAARKELDVDFAEHVQAWVKEILAALPKPEVAGVPSFEIDAEPEIRTGKGYNRLDPIKGTVSDIVNLNDQGSNKETYHIEIAFDDDLIYQPGDAIGIIMPYEEGTDMLTPRLYSIASSPAAHGNEIHLTVALAWHLEEDGEKGFGLCSRYLSELKEGDEISFYVQQNTQFKLPPLDRDMIMIGPGTGIAPFRSFVFERNEQGASGRNWLFFGDQQAHCDFLYQAEWIDHVEMDVLQHIDLAFSRDQEHKVYVQHRMQEKADELFEWIENGAYIYLCGNKDPMSKDVDETLRSIIAAKKGEDVAQSYLEELEDSGRYLKDVY
ncbi:MAG: flavodoxin domain-containing protein [Rickettsiales bacterium]|nr:flavodoxin domain-containing protein [Rickettsiales bacterium]